MNKKLVAGSVAAVAAGALFLGSQTTALWNDAVEVQGGTITAGNLDVGIIGDTTWQDISPDVANTPKAIDLATYRIVPQDVIQSSRDIDVALEGDNMKAKFDVGFGAGSTGALLAGTDVDVDPTEAGTTQEAMSKKGVTLTYTVMKGNTVVAENVTPGTATDVAITPAGVSGKVLDGTADYNVKVTATFDSTADERTRVMTNAVLDKMTVNLTQVR